MAWGRYSKYGNRKTVVDGIRFDSKHEAQRYLELKLMEKQGMIHGLELQKKYLLIPAQYEETGEIYTKGLHKGEPKKGKLLEREVSYYADFDYTTKEGEHVVEDAKGMRDGQAYAMFIVKRKLMLERFNIRVREV